MKVLHLCFTDSQDGGSIGAYRLHRAMLDEGVDSRMLVVHKRTDDPTVLSFSWPYRFLNRVNRTASAAILKMQQSPDPGTRSLNFFPTGTHRRINASNAEVVQLHWINRNMISIGEIAKIAKPVFWKLPDMWAFCGTEHYLNPGDLERYKEGYGAGNRRQSDKGIDLDRFLWQYKAKKWSHADFSVVCPSKWLANCARSSVLFKNRSIYNIANPIDLNVYRSAGDRMAAKEELGLSRNKKAILFGSLNAISDKRKGFQHLQKALAILTETGEAGGLELVILGESGPPDTRFHGLPVKYLGTVFDHNRIVKAYSAADVLVLPTELDNLPNTIQEAMACGTPCVGFDVGGLPDMITHGKTGYLARPFDEADFVSGIRWVLDQPFDVLTKEVRASAVAIHHPAGCVSQYLEMYREKIAMNGCA